VTLPDWEDAVAQPVTDGATYEEAARKGEGVLSFLIKGFQDEGKPLPTPKMFVA
jgi:predicted RNase H-like HicB family nuclease